MKNKRWDYEVFECDSGAFRVIPTCFRIVRQCPNCLDQEVIAWAKDNDVARKIADMLRDSPGPK